MPWGSASRGCSRRYPYRTVVSTRRAAVSSDPPAPSCPPPASSRSAFPRRSIGKQAASPGRGVGWRLVSAATDLAHWRAYRPHHRQLCRPVGRVHPGRADHHSVPQRWPPGCSPWHAMTERLSWTLWCCLRRTAPSSCHRGSTRLDEHRNFPHPSERSAVP